MFMNSISQEVLRTTVMQGHVAVGTGRNEILTTVLGSCIACCLFDPVARIGGMNHYLLSQPNAGADMGDDHHYGLYLMELLINEMMAKGSVKARMKAHIYGGANMHARMSRIGTANADFAISFLKAEGIELVRSDVGGGSARRVDFDPVLGRTRCRIVEPVAAPASIPTKRPSKRNGDVELF